MDESVDITAKENHYDPDNLNPDFNAYPSDSPAYPGDEDKFNGDPLNPFVGIWAGSVPSPPRVNPTTGVPYAANSYRYNTMFIPTMFTVSLECYDNSIGKWRPYGFMSRIGTGLPSDLTGPPAFRPPNPTLDGPRYRIPDPTGPPLFGMTVQGTQHETNYLTSVDVRTDRFSVWSARSNAGFGGGGARRGPNMTMEPNANASPFGIECYIPWRTSGFTYFGSHGTYAATFGRAPGKVAYPPAWMVNRIPSQSTDGETFPGSSAPHGGYYSDPDGIVRPADGFYRYPLPDTSYSLTSDGFQLLHNNQPATLPAGTNRNVRRPVILNRPFRSVGELGFVFRDVPFKTLDFFSDMSGDAALLDLFSVVDEPPVVAGKISPNNASPKTLQAILANAFQNEGTTGPSPVTLRILQSISSPSSNPDAESVASAIAASLSATPLRNQADLVIKLGSVVHDAYKTSSGSPMLKNLSMANIANKTYAEAPQRALSSVTNTRTWNLMIDIVAQNGTFRPNAPSSVEALNTAFVVQGERRYWLHIAIDRVTGNIVDQQLEAVYE